MSFEDLLNNTVGIFEEIAEGGSVQTHKKVAGRFLEHQNPAEFTVNLSGGISGRSLVFR